jgi:hypothetical protein
LYALKEDKHFQNSVGSDIKWSSKSAASLVYVLDGSLTELTVEEKSSV